MQLSHVQPADRRTRDGQVGNGKAGDREGTEGARRASECGQGNGRREATAASGLGAPKGVAVDNI